MSTYSDLEKFYDSEATKYHQTRQKYRADWEMIMSAILSQIQKEDPKVLELGCWWWRGAKLLSEHYHQNFSYTWVDISSKLLAYAKKDNPWFSFVHSDMNKYLASLGQESQDIILACASFQHIPDETSRIKILKNIFRVLQYDWIIVFTNWACSEWFLKTHRKALIGWSLKSLISFWKKSWRDVLIPRNGEHWKQYRYYHLYSLEELRKLVELSWLKIIELHYLDKKWQITEDWKQANNSFLVAKKTIFK
jgi:ubiquinone/menaquinone biosynthesis C-methylase UbiE